MSAFILKKFSVALLSLPSTSLKLLPWCLRLRALVKKWLANQVEYIIVITWVAMDLWQRKTNLVLGLFMLP